MTAHDPHPPKRHVHETAAMHDQPDAWHDHTHDAERPQSAHTEVTNASKIIATGLVLFMVIVVAVVAVYGYYTHYTTQRLTESEKTSSIGPGTAALQFKQDSLLKQVQGGSVIVRDAEGKEVPKDHTSFEAARQIARRQYVGAASSAQVTPKDQQTP